MSSGNIPKILRVGVIQGGKIVEERHLRLHETVTVGQDAKNTFVVPASDLPSTFAVFEARHGQYDLVFTERMDGRVRFGNSDVGFAGLRAQGLAKKRGNVFVLPLNEAAKGKVVLGEVTLLFQFVKPPPEPVKTELPPSAKGSIWHSMDQLFFLVLAGSLLVHFSGAGYLACSPRVEEHELSLDELPDRFARSREQGSEERGEHQQKEGKGGQRSRRAAPADPTKSGLQGIVEDSRIERLWRRGSVPRRAWQRYRGGRHRQGAAGAGGVGV